MGMDGWLERGVLMQHCLGGTAGGQWVARRIPQQTRRISQVSRACLFGAMGSRKVRPSDLVDKCTYRRVLASRAGLEGMSQQRMQADGTTIAYLSRVRRRWCQGLHRDGVSR